VTACSRKERGSTSTLMRTAAQGLPPGTVTALQISCRFCLGTAIPGGIRLSGAGLRMRIHERIHTIQG